MKIKRLFIIVFVAIVVGLVYNVLFDNIKLFSNAKENFSTEFKNNSQNAESDSAKWSIDPDKIEWHLIRVDQAYYVYEHNIAKFIDPRDEWDYAESHIKGSINIPFYKFNKAKVNFKNNEILIVYCEDESCDIGKAFCDSLVSMNFKNVFLYKGGLDEWKFANYPIEKSIVVIK